MALVFFPALIVLLESKENETGHELSRDEVETIRDNATVIQLPDEIASEIEKTRGYADLGAQNVWNEWLTYKLNRML